MDRQEVRGDIVDDITTRRKHGQEIKDSNIGGRRRKKFRSKKLEKKRAGEAKGLGQQGKRATITRRRREAKKEKKKMRT